MSSSDDDFLPDPQRSKRRKEPPDRGETSGSRGKKRKIDDPDNQQSGLYLRDDSKEGKCSFFLVCVTVSTCFHTKLSKRQEKRVPQK